MVILSLPSKSAKEGLPDQPTPPRPRANSAKVHSLPHVLARRNHCVVHSFCLCLSQPPIFCPTTSISDGPHPNWNLRLGPLSCNACLPIRIRSSGSSIPPKKIGSYFGSIAGNVRELLFGVIVGIFTLLTHPSHWFSIPISADLAVEPGPALLPPPAPPRPGSGCWTVQLWTPRRLNTSGLAWGRGVGGFSDGQGPPVGFPSRAPHTGCWHVCICSRAGDWSGVAADLRPLPAGWAWRMGPPLPRWRSPARLGAVQDGTEGKQKRFLLYAHPLSIFPCRSKAGAHTKTESKIVNLIGTFLKKAVFFWERNICIVMNILHFSPELHLFM